MVSDIFYSTKHHHCHISPLYNINYLWVQIRGEEKDKKDVFIDNKWLLVFFIINITKNLNHIRNNLRHGSKIVFQITKLICTVYHDHQWQYKDIFMSCIGLQVIHQTLQNVNFIHDTTNYNNNYKFNKLTL